MRKNKQGISLIVLVITIIVMIILAASVVISLNNTGIIDKTNQAVDITNEQQIHNLAAFIWAETYMENLRGSALITEVKRKLAEQKITEDDWEIEVTDTGVTVKEKYKGSTLGSLITIEDYGKKVDYVVTVDGTTYDDWQIYYHNSEYVYLIAAENIGSKTIDKGMTVASLTSDELALYEKFRVGEADKYVLVDNVNNKTAYNCQAVVQLIKDYASFANKTTYGTNVVGAIGAPTLELFVAGWNAKEYVPEITITTTTSGYQINGVSYITDLTSDGMYVPADYYYWLASPSANGNLYVMYAGRTYLNNYYYFNPLGIRPVICLKSSIPATIGTGNYDFSLIK